MLFGAPQTFAVEAVLEPGLRKSAIVGKNVTGRVRLHIAGHSVGNIDEPHCVLRSVSEHLVMLASISSSLWDPVLEGLSARAQFTLLDDCFFRGVRSDCPDNLRLTLFLTNVSEAFDDLKGFLISPAPGDLLALIEMQSAGVFLHKLISYTEFASTVGAFAQWVREQEHALLGRPAV